MLNDVPIKALTEETNKILAQAVNDGIADNDIPTAMKKALSEDVFLFSGFKTYCQLKEASLLLLDSNGKIKPFGKFYQEVKSLHQTYNKNYLEAEYIFATTSAQQAANWADIEKDGDRYDLCYRTAEDDRVRQSHAPLNQIVLPPSDPFWNKYYPPNGWRCRCAAVQTVKGKYPHSNSAEALAKGEEATTKIGKDGKNVLAIFRFNPGKQKVIFPPHHPYKPKGEQGEKIADILTSQIPSPADRTADYKKYKADENYTDVKMNDAGGLKATHKLHNFDKKRGHYEKEARDILFNKGYKVILEKELPAAGEKTEDGVRHIDGMLNDKSFEQATILGHGKNSIKHALQHAAGKNAEVPVLYFPNFTPDEKAILHDIKRFEGVSKNRFKKIVIITKEGVYEI